jgi:tetratricopeptide (TPR) repeat protein
VAEISEVMQSYFLEARIVNIVTGELSNVGSMYGNMTGAEDVVRISQAVTMDLLEGKRKLADYTYREVAANPDKAIKDYTEAIRQEPDVAEYYLKRGFAYQCKKEYDIAIADYTDAIRLNPQVALSYFGRGNAYGDKGDNDRAIADYNQAIRLDPNLAAAYNNRGIAYNGKGDNDRAIADYNQAIRLNPNFAYAYNNRGDFYHKKKDYDRAIADYNQAIRLDPNNAVMYYNRGVVYKGKGNYDLAIADFNQAIRLNPNDVEAYIVRGTLYGGIKKDYDRAIADCESALRIDPNNADAKKIIELARVSKQNSSGVSGKPIREMTIEEKREESALRDELEGNKQGLKKMQPKKGGISNEVREAAEAYYNKGVESMYICINLLKNLDRSNSQKFKEDMAEFETSYRTAMGAFTKAIQINPDYAEAYRKRGELYKIREQEKEANADFKMAEKIEKKLKKKK